METPLINKVGSTPEANASQTGALPGRKLCRRNSSPSRSQPISWRQVSSDVTSLTTPPLGPKRCLLDAEMPDIALPGSEEQLPQKEVSSDELGIGETIFNLSNTMVGSGVLSVPYAFRLTRYVAVALLALVVAMTAFTAMLVGQALELAASRPGASSTPPSRRDFGYLAEVAFGQWGNRIIAITTAMELWLAVVTFLVMSGINAQGLLGMDEPHAVAFCTMITAVMVFIPLRVYAYVSLASLAALCVASVAYLIDLFQMDEWNWPCFSAPEGVGDVFRAYGLIIFCFAGHPCFPALHQSMSDRSKWEPCVTFSFLVAAGYYVCLGLLAFLALGTNMHAVFTADMSGSGVLRRVTIAAFALKIQLTAPVLLRVVLTCLRVWPEGGELSLLDFGPSAMIVLATGFSACILAGHLAALASLCGAFLVNLTSVILPVVIYLQLEKLVPSTRTAAFKVKLGLCWAAVGLGVVAGVAGTAMAVVDFSHSPSDTS